MNNENMRVWDYGKKTDPSATKLNTQGGRKSTSINGYWMIQKATELWGPVGKDWGFEVLEDSFIDGVPILDKETGVAICNSKTHTIKLRLWFPECSQAGVISYGHTPYIYNSKHGPICDTEAQKKSLTDAIKKSLSMLGFSSDVFMGEFDDMAYIEERMAEEALEKAEDKDAERIKQAKEYNEWLEKHKELISSSTSIHELKNLFAMVYKKCASRKDEEGQKSSTLVYEKRKKQLSEGERNEA